MGEKTKSLILLVLVVLFIIISSCIILPNYKDIYTIFTFLYFLFCFMIGVLFFKINRGKSRIRFDTIQIIIMFTILYFIISYLMGIFLGFNRNPISLKIPNIIKNLFIYGFVITSEEFLRYNIVKNVKKSKLLLTLVVIVYTILGLLLNINSLNFSNKIDVFKFLSVDLLPAISLNIVLTYIVYKCNYIPTSIYRYIMELNIYLLPIMPNLGIYIEAIVGLVFPFLILFKLISIYKEEDVYERKHERIYKTSKITLVLMIAITASFAALVTGAFKCQIIAIVSNSMKPGFQRGDAVFFEKLDQKEIKKVKKGNIVIYNRDGIYVVHRIINIEKKNNTCIYTFKGDNNEVADDKKVYPNQLVGIVKFSIPKVGYPSVWLTERLK